MPTKSPTGQSNRRREIQKIYAGIKDRICSRLDEFRRIGKTGSDEELFAELVFCLLTPQSKATACWTALRILCDKELLLAGGAACIARELNIVRFKNKKARYIVQARRRFVTNGTLRIRSRIRQLGDPARIRDWLVKNIKGMGNKEASHFLRNIGLGEDLAILDRHILKSLQFLGIIDRIPNNLSTKRYAEIEAKMKTLAHRLQMPMSHLDLVLWFRETGEIFK